MNPVVADVGNDRFNANSRACFAHLAAGQCLHQAPSIERIDVLGGKLPG